MIRVTKFEVPDSGGISLMIASMSVAEADTFVAKGREMLARKEEITAEEWLSRRNATIVASLAKANPQGGTPNEEQLKNEFDMPTLDALYIAILKFSGLQPGEATAATASTPSAAA